MAHSIEKANRTFAFVNGAMNEEGGAGYTVKVYVWLFQTGFTVISLVGA